jgi:hypothetical protein
MLLCLLDGIVMAATMAMKGLCLGCIDKRDEAYMLVREAIKINIRCERRSLLLVLATSFVIATFATGARLAGMPLASYIAAICELIARHRMVVRMSF